MKNAKRNIRTILLMNVSWDTLLLVAIAVPFFVSRGLSTVQIFTVQSLAAVFLCLLDLPSGVFSDVFGRRAALVTASVCRGIGATLAAFSTGFGMIVLAYLFISAGNSLRNGTDTAIFYESHAALPEPKRPARHYLSLLHISSGIAVAVSALASGRIGEHSLVVAGFANMVVAWIALPVSLFIENGDDSRGQKAIERKETSRLVFRSVKRQIANDKHVRVLLIAAVSYLFVPSIALYGVQSLWSELDFPLTAFGYLLCLQSLVSALAGRFCLPFVRRFGMRIGILTLLLLPVIGFIGVATHHAVIAVITALAFEMVRAFVSILLVDALNQRLEAQSRATMNSFLTLGARMLLAVLGPAFAIFASKFGLSTAFATAGAVFVLLGLSIVRQLTHVMVRSEHDAFKEGATTA